MDSDGRKKAVVLDYEHWQGLLELLEDLADLQEVDRVRNAAEETIPWEQAKEELTGARSRCDTAGGALMRRVTLSGHFHDCRT